MSANTKVKVGDLWEKYPSLESEFIRMWKPITKQALANQHQRNASSSSLRGVKDIVKQHWPFLKDDEAFKIVDMISGRFNNSKFDPSWDDYRSRLPRIFNEDKIAQLVFDAPDSNGNSKLISINSQEEKFCSISFSGGELSASFNNVPKETALSILSELSKSLV